MSVRLRLRRQGRKGRPFYHIIAADSRTGRDGKFLETIGSYNPLTVPATIELDVDKAFKWVMNGAEPTDTVKRILSFKGVMYKKHLQRGVNKGAFTQEEAEAKFAEWVAAKLSKVQSRMEKELQKIDEKRAKRNEEEANKRSAKMVAKEEAAAAQVAEAEAELAEEGAEDISEDTASEETTSEEGTTEA
ncbi:MAG: 30S ribosomal protein S16 [Chitinophagales bacterium]|nr:30S ribosomal protein S16 [Bacteroidota bacterium]MCB9257435.1 30S ribosomal protein S16 [Chitinophagales bacterium]